MRIFLTYAVLFGLFLDLISLPLQLGHRRITNGGKIVGAPKRYMAYLLKAPTSPRQYDAWLCGGAIVNPLYILTSAACVEDIEFMYAIAGYEKYVPAEKINDDPCTKCCKKKVVFTCVPKMYKLNPSKVENWSFVDIAAVRVESPYIFDAPAPVKYCSWVPDQIEIGFEAKFQAPETDAMVMGWGHTNIWRDPGDTKDYNQEILQYSPTMILDKNICKASYKNVPDMLPIIEHYMICTMGEGNIESDGRFKINPPFILLDGCGLNNTDGFDPAKITCPNGKKDQGGGAGMRLGNFQDYSKRRAVGSSDGSFSAYPLSFTRRNGICQNDHGGPLVTWIGGKEILIGVASVFIVDAKDRSCVGPYLHTSTFCNGAFLNCVLKLFDEDANNTDNIARTMPFMDTPEMMMERRNREEMNQRYQLMLMMNTGLCDLPAEERGFEMVKRKISWMRHPDGPAENEFVDDLIERPQVPLRSYYQPYGG